MEPGIIFEEDDDYDYEELDTSEIILMYLCDVRIEGNFSDLLENSDNNLNNDWGSTYFILLVENGVLEISNYL